MSEGVITNADVRAWAIRCIHAMAHDDGPYRVVVNDDWGIGRLTARASNAWESVVCEAGVPLSEMPPVPGEDRRP